MTFADLSDFLDDDFLPITLKGKEYRVASPDAETGLRLSALANIGARLKAGKEVPPEQIASIQLDDQEERQFITLILGDTLDEFIADGYSWVAVSRIAQYAFTHFIIGAESARKAYEAGVFSGKAEAPNRAARRAVKAPSAPRDSTASRTPRKAATTKKASPGRASSSSGRS